jgi:hypothetical protein
MILISYHYYTTIIMGLFGSIGGIFNKVTQFSPFHLLQTQLHQTNPPPNQGGTIQSASGRFTQNQIAGPPAISNGINTQTVLLIGAGIALVLVISK